jgi:ComF family protein
LFDGVLRQAIHRFKYERLAAMADPFGDMLADYWRAEQLAADWLIPVPLHPSRERDRGYNQSELLARQLARRVNVPVSSHGLRRIRATAVQMTLNAAQRRENVAGAFECGEQRVRGKRVVIVDDVGTTGATLEACAQAVLQAGAASVMGLTLARTP